MKKSTHQMLKALLMSKDLHTGLLAYDLLYKKFTPEKALQLLKAKPEELSVVPPYFLRDVSEREAYAIFMHAVLKGDINDAMTTANEDDLSALKEMKVLQMLQGLLPCADKRTGRLAYEILAGIETIDSQFKNLKPSDEFFKAVLENRYADACKLASTEQLTSLHSKDTPTLSFTLSSVENLHRLHYIMFDQKMKLNDVVNIMVESYYDILRADEHAQLQGEGNPQIYKI